jgi:hypothetical protein
VKHLQSIAFIVPEFRPTSCGVSDYSVRLLGFLGAAGYKTAILCLNDALLTKADRTAAGSTTIAGITKETLDQYDLVALQYVYTGWYRLGWLMRLIGRRNKSRLHLMIHECWRQPSLRAYSMWPWWIPALREWAVLRYLCLITRPGSVATSNLPYQRMLGRAGIKAFISPIIGTIDVFKEDPPIDVLRLPLWWNERPDFILWVVFGSLYTNNWSVDTILHRLFELQEELGKNFKFVICGRQVVEDLDVFTESAIKAGFLEAVHYAGKLPPEAVDWWLRQADASIAGTCMDLWQKSTGVLAALERDIPIFFTTPQTPILDSPLMPKLLTSDPASALSRKFPTSASVEEKWVPRAVGSFINDVIR